MVAHYPMLLRDSVRLHDAMDRFFGEPVLRTLATSSRSTGTYSIPVDVFMTEAEVVVIASTPGLGPDDLDVTIEKNVLTLSGLASNAAKSSNDEGAVWYLHENRYGQFRRMITLPAEVDADQADATFEHGVLRLRLPKAQSARPRQIKVRSASSAEVTAESSIPASEESDTA